MGRTPPTRTSGAPLCLALPGRTLLLVAGLPGAGKSTLLAGLRGGADTAVLDSDTDRAVFARLLPGVAYRRYRPLVHLRHRLGAVLAAVSRRRTVVLHLPATSAGTRATVARLAALTGRAAHLLWVHAEPAEALVGQRERGRVIPESSFAGHAGRAALTTDALRSGVRSPGFASATLVDRTAVRAGLWLDT